MSAVPAWLIFGPKYENTFLDIACELIVADYLAADLS